MAREGEVGNVKVMAVLVVDCVVAVRHQRKTRELGTVSEASAIMAGTWRSFDGDDGRDVREVESSTGLLLIPLLLDGGDEQLFLSLFLFSFFSLFFKRLNLRKTKM